MTTPPQVEYRIIPLTQGQVAYVSPDRYDDLMKFKWYALKDKNSGRFYAVRLKTDSSGKRRMVIMHREILGLKHGDIRTGDHVDHTQTLNNTDTNLRIANKRNEQQHNKGIQRNSSSGYKGVTFNRNSGKWESRIRVNGARKWLGYFSTPELAHQAYCDAALYHFGEFACFG